MKNPFNTARTQKDCDHRDTISGSSSGIQRTVCKTCGHVSVSHVSETVTRGFGSQDR